MACTETELVSQADSNTTKPVASENILNSCRTVEELERLTSVYEMISELSRGLPEAACDKSMAAKFRNELLEIEAALQSLKNATAEAQELKNDLRAIMDDVKEHIRQNIDNYILNSTIQSSRRCAALGNDVATPAKRPVEPRPERISGELPTESEILPASGTAVKSEADNKRTNTAHKKDGVVAPVSAEELRRVPDHIRGRLTVERVNETLDMLREVTQLKYRLLKTRKGLTIAEKDEIIRMRSEMVPTLRGTRFISEKDIYLFKQRRLPKSTMNHLSVLRHLQKIREVRDKNILRIVLQS